LELCSKCSQWSNFIVAPERPQQARALRERRYALCTVSWSRAWVVLGGLVASGSLVRRQRHSQVDLLSFRVTVVEKEFVTMRSCCARSCLLSLLFEGGSAQRLLVRGHARLVRVHDGEVLVDRVGDGVLRGQHVGEAAPGVGRSVVLGQSPAKERFGGFETVELGVRVSELQYEGRVGCEQI